MMRTTALCGLLIATAVAVLGDNPCTGKPDSKFCGNCQTVHECASETLTEKTCVSGQVCDETGGGPVCTDTPSSEFCSCTGDSQCDPYDDTIVMLCDPNGGGILMTIQCTGEQQCVGGQCGVTTTVDPALTTAPPPDTCDKDSVNTWKPIYPGCTAYGFCFNDTATAVRLDCEAGQYYDEIVSACQTAPPTPCTGCEGDDCPDPNDCTLYHSCQGGVSTSSYQCAEGEYFDSINNECADTSDNCDPRIACAYGSDATTPIGGGTTSSSDGVTTSSSDGVTTPSGDSTTLPSEECSENNAYQMYPDPDNCKMYYQCALMPSGDYTLVHGTCPGKLVYNPDTDLCDLNSNVPDCVV